MKALRAFAVSLLDSSRDLTPIIPLIAFFQLAVFQQPLLNLGNLISSALLMILGLTLFVRGLEMGFLLLEENMAYAFAKKGNVW